MDWYSLIAFLEIFILKQYLTEVHAFLRCNLWLDPQEWQIIPEVCTEPIYFTTCMLFTAWEWLTQCQPHWSVTLFTLKKPIFSGTHLVTYTQQVPPIPCSKQVETNSKNYLQIFDSGLFECNLHIMNSRGTCLKLFNFPSEAEASPHQLMEAD